MNDLKVYCKHLVIDGNEFSLPEFVTRLANRSVIEITENGSYHKITIGVVNPYVKLYIEYGNPMPHPDHVINIVKLANEDNPRSEDQIEPKQMFILIDSRKSRVWLSNIQKNAIIPNLFYNLGFECDIKNIYNTDTFISKLESVNGIKLTSTPDCLFKLSKLNEILDYDIYGYGADAATLDLKYNKSRHLKGSIKDNIRELFGQRASFETFIVSGKDDGNMDVVFNNESVVEKIFLDLKVNENGEYEKEEVFTEIIRRIGI